MEVRIGDNSGMMNIGIPSIVVKMLRHKFDQQWSVRKSQSTEQEQARILRLVKPGTLHVDTRLEGPTLRVEDLMDLKIDDVLKFDYPVTRDLNLTLNGSLKYRGHIVTLGHKRAFEIDEVYNRVV